MRLPCLLELFIDSGGKKKYDIFDGIQKTLSQKYGII